MWRARAKSRSSSPSRSTWPSSSPGSRASTSSSPIPSRASAKLSKASTTACPSRHSTCREPSRKYWRKPNNCRRRSAMADTLSLEVATPERELVRELVSDVQVPGKNGYMGILPGHAPLLGLLGIGTLTYLSVSDGKKRYLSVHQGFLEVLEDHVRALGHIGEHANMV